jgi:hypothetical protein
MQKRRVLMSALQDFLLETCSDNVTDKVVISPRFKDRPFTIRAMTGKEFTEYQQAATKIHKGKRVDFNSSLFREKVIINHTLEPNFKDAEFIKKAGCVTPEQLLNKVLLAGEIMELSEQISALSGFDQNMDEAVDEAKNS